MLSVKRFFELVNRLRAKRKPQIQVADFMTFDRTVCFGNWCDSLENTSYMWRSGYKRWLSKLSKIYLFVSKRNKCKGCGVICRF